VQRFPDHPEMQRVTFQRASAYSGDCGLAGIHFTPRG
jgi:hypothetical protein